MNPQSFAILSVVAGVIVTLFWMLVGWRAMRAHEKIADTLSDKEGKTRRFNVQVLNARHRMEMTFAKFLDEDPLAKHLDANEQAKRFVKWKENQKKV